MTTSPPRPYALCWVSAASDPSTIRTGIAVFARSAYRKFRSVGGGAYTLRAGGEGFRGSAMSVVVSHQPLSGKVKLKIAIKENVTVSAAGSEPVASDSNANAIRLTDNFLRALPTEGPDLQPVLSKFISPAAAGTAGISLVLDGLEADQLDDIPSSSIKRITIDKNPYAAEFRRPGEARVEITTKSGSPTLFHGGIALFARSSPGFRWAGVLGESSAARNASPKERCSDNSLTTFPNAYTASPHLKKT